jgi:hypothetical protein
MRLAKMSVIENLAVAFDAIGRSFRSPFRGEPRRDEIRIVEYTPFPRVGADEGARIAFTRDVSPSGMCIASDRPELVGALLRVVLRRADGRPDPSCIERVVWCEPAGDGRHWIGLERITSPAVG